MCSRIARISDAASCEDARLVSVQDIVLAILVGRQADQRLTDISLQCRFEGPSDIPQ